MDDFEQAGQTRREDCAQDPRVILYLLEDAGPFLRFCGGQARGFGGIGCRLVTPRQFESPSRPAGLPYLEPELSRTCIP
jgi:hypothetical protein